MKSLHWMSLLIVLFSSLPSFADTDLQIAEKKVRWVWSQTLPFLKACLLSDDCPLTGAEKELATRIAENSDSYSDKTIQFVSEVERPDLFTSAQGETHRLIVTGSNPDSPIYINSTRVLAPSSSLTIESLFGLFAHELIHHLGIADDAQRLPDRFGVKFASLVKDRMTELDLSNSNYKGFILNLPQPIMPEFTRYFPKGLHPRFVMITQGAFIAQEYAMLYERGKDVCLAGDIWSTHGDVSHVGEKDLGSSDEINLQLRLTARCYLKDKNSLQEELSYLSSRVQIDKTTGKLLVGTYDVGKVMQDQTSGQGLQVLDLQVPSQVQAGSTLELEATVNLLYDKPVKGCAAIFMSPSWAGTKENMPLSAPTSDCTLVSQNGKQFHMKLRMPIPAKAPAGLQIQVAQLYLQLADGNYVMGRPADVKLIQILSNASATVAFKGIQFLGAQKIPGTIKNGYYVMRGEPFVINFQFSGASALIDGNCEFVMKMIDQGLMFGSFVLKEERVSKVTSSIDANGILNVTLTLDPQHITAREVVQMAAQEIVFLTSDWNYLKINLEADEYMISEVVRQ